MVTSLKASAVGKTVYPDRGWVTPSPVVGEERVRKRARLSSPISSHAIHDVEQEVQSDHESDHADVVDVEGKAYASIQDYNILIPQLSFLKFISDNFNCKHCNGKFRQRTILVDKIGLASNVFWKCPNKSCLGAATILAPTCQKEATGKFRRRHPTTPRALGDYAINRQVVLACQQSGGGARMASTFGGVLSISKRSIWIKCFTQVEEMIAKSQIVLGRRIIAENLSKEIALSPMNEELQQAKLTLMMDGGWDQRASGKAYNSASGRHVSIGGRTNKVCALVYYSKRCSKCEKGLFHTPILCANPDKYDKSSRAMESLGAVETVLEIWKSSSKAYVATIVTDEDSTTRSKLSHSMADLVSAGRMAEEERRYKPKIAGRLGSKKDDHGMLPLAHPTIEKLSDPIHYVKNYKSELYVWVNASKTKSQTCKADAMRLSRNLAYMLAQYKRGTENCTLEKFERAAKASFQHHWNDHQFCGSWCQARDWNEEEKEKNKNKFRDKEKNPKEYQQQLEIQMKFTETDRMKRVFHEWSTNKTEQIHSLVTNVFLPKRSYYCRTICGRARTYLAVSIDSLGYLEYNKRLYLELGLELSCIAAGFYNQQDQRRNMDQVYANTPARRKLRAQQRLENINKEWLKEVIDRRSGNTYRSAMTAPTVVATETHSDTPVVDGSMSKERDRPFCRACKNYGHQRRSSRLCPKNKLSKYYEGKCSDFDQIVSRLKNYRLCNLIWRASRSVLTYRTLSTYREFC
jgi:hypothetical protein